MIHNRVNPPLFHNCSQSTSEQKKCKQEQRTLHQWLNSLPRRWRGENGGSFSDDIHDVVTLQHRFQCSQSNLSNAFCDRACRSQIFSPAYGTGSWYVLWYQSMIIIMDLKDLYRVLSTRYSLTTCLAQVIQLKCIMHYDCRSWLQPIQSTDTKCPGHCLCICPVYTLVSDLVWGASHELGLSSVKSDYGACQELIFYIQEFLCPNLDIVKTLTLLRHGTKWLYQIELDLLLHPMPQLF